VNADKHNVEMSGTLCGFLVTLLAMGLQAAEPEIPMGHPLPPGKVRPQLVNVWDKALLLAPDGSLWAWGGTYSSLTNVFPQPTVSQVPVRIGSDSDWTQVASSVRHTVALKDDGSLWAWGDNGQGQVGQSNLAYRYVAPTRIGTETNWTQICTGSSHSLALKNDGSLWAFGWNDYGQLGDGTTVTRRVPTRIGAKGDWRAIAAGGCKSFALKSNGTIWAWGDFGDSNALMPQQIEPGTDWLAISAYGFTLLARKTDGTIWQTLLSDPLVDSAAVSGPAANLTQMGRDSDWSEIYAGGDSFFARKSDDSWWVCGKNYEGQLGLGSNVTAVPSLQRLPFSFEPWAFAPGLGTTLLLRKDGKLWTWGTRLGVAKSALDQVDQTPHLLWELPPEVRRALGIGRTAPQIINSRKRAD
jgi:alpha-tubulin suppressor-like RCC1 family protein